MRQCRWGRTDRRWVRETWSALSRASEPVEWSAEYRCFIKEGEVAAWSPYISFGRPSWNLVMIYHLLKEGTAYAELGADFFDRLDTDRLTRALVRRLERWGHEVVLKPKEPAA